MVRVLLGLVKMTLGDTVEGVAGVGVTVLGFTVPCGRFDLYHSSALSWVLNFLNFVPGNPWTYSWASSLHTIFSHNSRNTSRCTVIARTYSKRSPVRHNKTIKETHQVVNTPISRPLHTVFDPSSNPTIIGVHPRYS